MPTDELIWRLRRTAPTLELNKEAAARLEALAGERDGLVAALERFFDDGIVVRAHQIFEQDSQPGMVDFRMCEVLLDALDDAKPILAPYRQPEASDAK